MPIMNNITEPTRLALPADITAAIPQPNNIERLTANAEATEIISKGMKVMRILLIP